MGVNIEYCGSFYHIGLKDGEPWISKDLIFVRQITPKQAAEGDDTIRDYILGRLPAMPREFINIDTSTNAWMGEGPAPPADRQVLDKGVGALPVMVTIGLALGIAIGILIGIFIHKC